MSIALNDLGLGRLECISNGEEIDYRPFEVSHTGLGIIARAGIPLGLSLAVHTLRGPIELRVISSNAKGVPSESARYNLMAEDGVDLESVFAESGCFDRIARLKTLSAGDEASRAAQFRNIRFGKGPVLTIVAQTFGTAFRYPFRTRDISRSGLLMASERDIVVPFLSNTLLEITIDPEGEWLALPIQCVAKVVRLSASADPHRLGGRPEFGVNFVEMSEEVQRYWRGMIDIAEKVYSKSTRLAA